MEKETAEKAKRILKDISDMEKIKEAMMGEPDHWWAFISPDIKRTNEDVLFFPESFRKNFYTTVCCTIAQLEEKLNEL